jgi:hypothetical protein
MTVNKSTIKDSLVYEWLFRFKKTNSAREQESMMMLWLWNIRRAVSSQRLVLLYSFNTL